MADRQADPKPKKCWPLLELNSTLEIYIFGAKNFLRCCKNVNNVSSAPKRLGTKMQKCFSPFGFGRSNEIQSLDFCLEKENVYVQSLLYSALR